MTQQTNFAVQLAEVTKAFNGIVAVQQVSLEVAAGQILTILGPSGCGKTTLLRLIAGFERPDSGEVWIAGEPMSTGELLVAPEKRRVGMVFQQPALFPHLSVAENIGFGLAHYSDDERRARVQHLLNLTRLPQAHDRWPHELSGGQRQRVALARALAPEPAVILMDEPFSSLDADQRRKLRDEIRFILKQARTTVIFVTHDQEEALFMGDEMTVMRDGRLMQRGQPEAVFRFPVSSFIAEFLGQAEFLPARVTASGLQTEIGLLPQSVVDASATEVDVGFRADDVAFDEADDGDDMVLARFFQGAVCLYRLRLASGRIIHSMQPHYRRLTPGTPVRARFEPNHALPVFRNGTAVATELLNGERSDA